MTAVFLSLALAPEDSARTWLERPVVEVSVTRDPVVAAMMSAQAPGFGQFYNGDWFKALTFLATEVTLFSYASRVLDAVAVADTFYIPDADGNYHTFVEKRSVSKFDTMNDTEKALVLTSFSLGLLLHVVNIYDAYTSAERKSAASEAFGFSVDGGRDYVGFRVRLSLF